MRIGYVINRIEIGGPSNVIRNIVNNLDRDNNQVILITLLSGSNDEKVVKELQEKKVRVECVNYSKNSDCFLFPNRFVKLVKELKPDIVHSHGFIPDFLVSKLKKCRCVSTLHCRLFEDYTEVYGNLKGIVLAKIHLYILKKLDKVVCCSKAVKDHVVKYLPHCIYIENGIEPATVTEEPIVTRSGLGIPDGSIVYIYTGQLRKRKNIVWLIGAFAKAHRSNEYLLVLGKGTLLEECKAAADDNILILGFQKNVNQYLNLSDVFVSASLSEGFSISVLEALSMGLGVFLSNIPSHSEIFEIDSNYYIGEIFSSSTFDEKINRLRSNYNQINRSSVKDFIKKYLSAEHMTACYLKEYKKLL